MAGNPNPSPATRFTKDDPRRWRGGKPKSFDQLRALAQQIAHETAKASGNTVVIDGHSVTVAEAVIRQWFQSKEFAKQKAALEIAFGKVPDTPQPQDVINWTPDEWRKEAANRAAQVTETLETFDDE